MLLHTIAIFGCEYKHLIVHFFNIVRPDRGLEGNLNSWCMFGHDKQWAKLQFNRFTSIYNSTIIQVTMTTRNKPTIDSASHSLYKLYLFPWNELILLLLWSEAEFGQNLSRFRACGSVTSSPTDRKQRNMGKGQSPFLPRKKLNHHLPLFILRQNLKLLHLTVSGLYYHSHGFH